MDKVYWDTVYRDVLSEDLSIGLIRRCVHSITFNDEAHNLNHVLDVCKLAKELCIKNDITGIDRKIILAGALMHDLGCRYDRDTHHFLSYGMSLVFLEQEENNTFNDEQKLLIAKTCLEHRASYKGTFSSFHSAYVALADRGEPDIEKYIERAVLFRKDSGLTLDIFKEEVYKHLLEKFNPIDGYAWRNYPSLGLELYKDEWVGFNSVLSNAEACLQIIENKHFNLIR